MEGADPHHFFTALAGHLGIDHLQIHDFGGVRDLRQFLRVFVDASDFPSVINLGIVRDAETDAAAAFQSVRDSLRYANLPVPDAPETTQPGPPAITTMILPGGNRPGMLETLLREAVADHAVRPCVTDFMACLEALHGAPPQRPDKATARALLAAQTYLQGYLATRRDPHLSVGIAAKRGYWPLDHAVLQPVRAFLQLVAGIGKP